MIEKSPQSPATPPTEPAPAPPAPPSEPAAAAVAVEPRGGAPLWFAVARAVAMFIGAFSLLNLAVELRSANFDPNLWWIDFAPLPQELERVWLLVGSCLLLAWAVMPRTAPWRRRVTASVIELLWIVIAWNILNFYGLILRGRIHAGFPVPFSLFVAGALFLVWRAVLSHARPRSSNGVRRWVTMILTLAACAVLFPVLQMLCFGMTDYRRAADTRSGGGAAEGADVAPDAIVVFGARVYPDGRPSDALLDRVELGVELYKEYAARHKDKAPKLVLTGGKGADETMNETVVMEKLAADAGVRPSDILLDPAGSDTNSSVLNTMGIFADEIEQPRGHEGAGTRFRIVAVSHFYHLPRVKMTYNAESWPRYVYTVPVKRYLRGTPWYMLREVGALWWYYLSAALH